MSIMSFETGVAVGEALQRLKSVEQHTEELQQGQDEIRREVASLRAWLQRGALLLALWGSSTGLFVQDTEAADGIARLIKTLLRAL